MHVSSLGACLVLALLLGPPSPLSAADPAPDQEKPNLALLAQGPETLRYGIEWRVFSAGTAKLTLQPQNKDGKQEWQSSLRLESSGVIAALYKVTDEYNVHLEDDFCATNSTFSAEEGKRNRETKVLYDRTKGRATYLEKDRVKNSILKAGQTDIPGCVSDVIGGMYLLRTMKIEPGQSMQLSLSDGKKAAQVRVDVKEREEVQTKLGKFKTVRCEAFLFNGVLFARKATLDIWLTDDQRHVPVQIRIRLPIVIGTITFQLEKEERS